MTRRSPAAASDLLGAGTVTKKALADAIETYYAEAEKKELLDLLKAIGVVVR